MTDYTWSTLALTGFNFTVSSSMAGFIFYSVPPSGGYQSASFQTFPGPTHLFVRSLFDLQVSVSIAEVFAKPELLVQVLVAEGLLLLERWRVQQVWAHEYTMHGIYTVDLADTRPFVVHYMFTARVGKISERYPRPRRGKKGRAWTSSSVALGGSNNPQVQHRQLGSNIMVVKELDLLKAGIRYDDSCPK
ncbi:hypothetical protein GG344DRAFT_67034 [Lentinula edodes]|nr:hypothetical protein GG344DRAFT_67034 [Lentinula edodes]